MAAALQYYLVLRADMIQALPTCRRYPGNQGKFFFKGKLVFWYNPIMINQVSISQSQVLRVFFIAIIKVRTDKALSTLDVFP